MFLVIFGLYEKILDSVLHFFKNIKANFRFLLPIVLGAFLGVFLLSRILQTAFSNFFVVTSYIFIGLILGSLPAVYKQSNIKKISFFHLICLALTLSFSIYLSVLEKSTVHESIAISNNYLILTGFFMSAGIVVPGVSKTAILMMMGMYSGYLSAISSINFAILIPLGIGIVLGGFIFMHIINYLFKHFKSYTYFLIIGFVIGSIFVIFPGFELTYEYLIGFILMFISFFAAFKLSTLDKNAIKGHSLSK